MARAKTGELQTGQLRPDIVRSAEHLLVFQDAGGKFLLNFNFANRLHPFVATDLNHFLVEVLNPCLPEGISYEAPLPNNTGIDFLRAVSHLSLQLYQKKENTGSLGIRQSSANAFQLKRGVKEETDWGLEVENAVRLINGRLSQKQLDSIKIRFQHLATGKTNGANLPKLALDVENNHEFHRSLRSEHDDVDNQVRDVLHRHRLYPSMAWVLNSLMAAYANEMEKFVQSSHS